MLLTQEQTKSILENAPVGADKNKIIENLVKKGYEFEGLDTAQVKSTIAQTEGMGGVKGFALGAVKSGAETLQNIGKAVMKPISAVTGLSQEGLGIPESALERKGGAEQAGAFAEQVAEFAIPSAKIGKLANVLGLGSKATLGAKALTSGAVATAQEGEIGKESAIATGAELAFPVVSKVARGAGGLISRLFKGVGSTTSGVGAEALEAIVRNPETAKSVIKQISTEGTEPIIRQNAQSILDGVRKIRREARKSYGEGIETLAKTDIDPAKFRGSTQKFLDKYGVSMANGERTLAGVEFENPKLLQKASQLIDELSSTELDGKNLRNLLKKVETSKFKTAGSDPERLSYNAFAKDFASTINEAIKKSTGKLDKINAAFSGDMQLVEGVEKIFGNMKFYNEKELITASEKLSQLFNKKGLAPSTIDKFMNRIGISPDDFRTTEAVRQITEKDFGANQIGTTIVVTPELVRDVAVKIGTSGDKLAPVLNAIEPSLRPVFVTSIVDLFSKDE